MTTRETKLPICRAGPAPPALCAHPAPPAPAQWARGKVTPLGLAHSPAPALQVPASLCVLHGRYSGDACLHWTPPSSDVVAREQGLALCDTAGVEQGPGEWPGEGHSLFPSYALRTRLSGVGRQQGGTRLRAPRSRVPQARGGWRSARWAGLDEASGAQAGPLTARRPLHPEKALANSRGRRGAIHAPLPPMASPSPKTTSTLKKKKKTTKTTKRRKKKTHTQQQCCLSTSSKRRV